MLDTHTAIWFFTDDPALSSAADQIITNRANRIYLSAISAWEMTIKISIGKLRFPGEIFGFMNAAKNNDIIIVPIETTHLAILKDLPHIHRDPFDRLLISTAIAEQMTFITADENIARYDVAHIW